MNRQPMKKVKQTIDLLLKGRSYREIEQELNISRSLVGKWLKRIKGSGVTLKASLALTDEELHCIIYPPMSARCHEPDWEDIFDKLSKIKKLTIGACYQRLYLPTVPEGQLPLKQSSFYQSLARQKILRGCVDSSCVKPEFDPGEVMEIDYAGGKYLYKTPDGKSHYCRLFVAILPYSRMTFVMATNRAKRCDWIAGIIGALEYFKGAPKFMVMDNDTALVDRIKEKWDPTINPAIEQLAEHYQMKLHACRVREPRDKQAAEAAANDGQKLYALLRLQPMCFRNLEALNQALIKELDKFNRQNFTKHTDSSRLLEFEAAEQSQLTPLPNERYANDQWAVHRVNPQHHFSHKGHEYSVPVKYVGKDVHIKIASETIFVYESTTSDLICQHQLHTNAIGRKRHTLEDHLTEKEKSLRFSPERYIALLNSTGLQQDHAAEVVRALFSQNKISASGWCWGIHRYLKKNFEIASCQIKFLLECGEISYRELAQRIDKALKQKDINRFQTRLPLESLYDRTVGLRRKGIRRMFNNNFS